MFSTSSTSTWLRRRSVTSWLGVMVIALAVSAVGPAGSQAPVSQESKVTIDLGTADGPAGRTVSVPVNVGVPEDTTVTGLELEISFEKNMVSYARTELAPAGTAAGAQTVAKVEPDPNNTDRSILRITATSERPFSSGAVVDVFFRIVGKGVKPRGSTGHTAAKVTAVLKNDAKVRIGERLLIAKGRDGEIDITEGVAIFGCFFYMH